MDSPYRSAPRTDAVEAPRDAGIVGDVVSQFADPLAFYRELAQNAIDAGTPTVEVELRLDEPAGVARAVVRDRGEGMDPDIIENSLLVLFRSTKDRDPTKIGKFGIGFASVLAPGPRVVVVDTARAGRRSILHLYPDLSYQLFDGGPATRSGTTVELELPVAAGAFAALARRSGEVLARWCRHAAVPIHFTARGAGGATLHDGRIDAPLGLDDALVEVRAVSADGATTAVVGLRPGAVAYGGFFNRGLMLHETDAALVPGVAFKVLDPRLGHTLSRDDVRRDAAFERALALVRQLATRDLPRAVAAALAAAAATDPARWHALFVAADTADLALAADEWVVPLVTPVGEQRAVAAAELPANRVWSAHASTPLVAALATAGVPVLATAAGGASATLVEARLARSCKRRPAPVHAELTLIEAHPPTASDAALEREVIHLLDRALRAPTAVVLATLRGALEGAVCLTGAPADAVVRVDERRWIVDRAGASKSPFGRVMRRTVVLDGRHPLTAAARRAAETEPVRAAAALARLVLLHHGALTAEVSTALLAATVERLGLPGGTP